LKGSNPINDLTPENRDDMDLLQRTSQDKIERKQITLNMIASLQE